MKSFKSIKTFNKSVSNDLFEKILVLPSNINLKKKDILYFKKMIDIFFKTQ